ncbi:DUF5000 domain-containing lipoprotein [Paraflavitalea soli]|nr:DUF5000 domain-containing lipoprotein [Paraflavitalea soli]
MKQSLNLSLLTFSIGLFAWSCSKVDSNTPLTPSKGTPAKVANVTVRNDSAKAILTYTLPNAADIAYIKAVYDLASEKSREVKASVYDNQLILDGFGDTLEHQVKVYAVNKAEVASEPVTVTVKPLENPIWGVFRAMKVVPDFAGIRVITKNPARFNIAIEILQDSLGQWFPFNGIYTSTDSINTAIRGMDTLSKKLAFFVRDRFLNRTDTLFQTITPFYETAIAKSDYREYTLPGDAVSAWASNRVANLWDGNWEHWPGCNITKDEGMPSVITFEIGRLTQLSRIVIWDYAEYLNSGRGYYYGGNPRKFEIWASPNPPLDGSWSNWTLMAACEEVKPSGLPYGQLTNEDRTAGMAGFNWDLRADVSKMRYIRIKCNQNWSGGFYQSLSEVQVYGDPR